MNINLPTNHSQYSASEICATLLKCERDKVRAKDFTLAERKRVPILTKIITSMIEYKNVALIPCSAPTMFRIFSQYKKDPKTEWPVKGRLPIYSNSVFISAIEIFESDENQAVGNADMNTLLKMQR